MTKPKTNTTIGGKDYYRIRKKIDGQIKTFYGRSKADAEKKCEDYINGRDGHRSPHKPRGEVFGTLASIYIKSTLNPSQKYATATKERYANAYKTHIHGTWLDKMRVQDIRASDVQEFYNEAPVSKQTLSTINKFMRGFCRWLVLNGYADDFLNAVEIPKKPENKRHDEIVVWEEDEVSTILSKLHDHRLYFFVLVLLYTGARMSEAIALKHKDIRDGAIHIARQCYQGETKLPKYGSSRNIPLHDALQKAYKEYIEWQIKDMEKNGYETDLLFTTSTGRMYDPKAIRKSLKRFYDAHGMPHKTPHAYRSTFCTQLCRCGVPIEVASSLMGHKSIEVTAQHYAKVQSDSKEDAIALLHF